ncbi:MAG TPA: nuclear transport factor 2 family protein [Gaiellaceae bacterium]|jgi:limonene-1,2-epoxide hydrolase|nr:nuclear transport factor 2 family protein [Gaiellaceae bacterium]
MEVGAWLERYRAAWEEADAGAAAALFTDDAVYWSSPFREAHRGPDGIRDYWTRATADQRDVRVRFGRPIAEGRRVAVEWWTTMRDEATEITLPGILFLRFAPDGRCEELRETWMVAEQRLEPHPGWGT